MKRQRCGVLLQVWPGFYVSCEMTGHTKPNTLGPTHRAFVRANDGRTPVVITWPTMVEPEGVSDDG